MDNFAFLLPFFMLVFGSLFLLARLWGQTSATPWGIGYLCAAAGFCAPLYTFMPLLPQAILANALFFAAFFFYGEALTARFKRNHLRPLRLTIALVAFCGITWSMLFRADMRNELLAADTTLILLLVPSVLGVLTAVRKKIDCLLLVVVGMVIAETTARVVAFALSTTSGDAGSLDTYLGSDYAFFSQLAASIVAFLLALTVLGTVVFDIINQYQQAAEQDPLTGLLNRRGFDQIFTRERSDRPVTGTFIIGDIDHFKQINDGFGHAAGDAVIRTLADILRGNLPADAVIARFGGEEFVAFLPDHAPVQAASRADTVRQVLAGRSWTQDGFDRRITMSFGVAARAMGDHLVHDAIGRADAALYEAKRSGRNKVIVEGYASSHSDRPAARIVSARSA